MHPNDPTWESKQLASISKELSSKLDKADVIEFLCRAARQLAEADGACVILREGEMVHYSRCDAIAPLWAGQRFPISNCISGWSILHRASVVIEDIYADERIPVESYQDTFVKSLAMMPIQQDDPLGVVGVYWARQHRATERQLDRLETLADLAAVAFVNVHLFDEMTRARREAEARAEELKRQAHLINQSYDALLSWELGGTIVFWSEGAEELYGFTTPEAVGQVSHELLQTVFPSTAAEFEAALRQAGRWEGELLHTRKEGEKIVVDSRCKVVSEDGRRYVLESNRDITGRRRDEIALRQQREWLQVTLASIGDAVITTDMDGTVTFINPVAEALTGWHQEIAIGRPLTEVFNIVNEQTRLSVENPALRAIREGIIFGLANHTVLMARDGTEVPIDDSGAPIKDADGKILGAVLIFRDISERRRVEKERALLAGIVESSDDAIIGKNLDGIIESWNVGAQRLFGYTADEAVGQPVTIIIPPDRLDEERLILERLRRGERIDHFETIRLSKGGQALDISLTVSPIRNAAGRIIGASKIARDIGERRRAEQERELLLAREQAARNHAEALSRMKDEFLATISHELRTPLNAILGWATLLRRQTLEEAAAARGLETIERNAKVQAQLIEDVLDVSRITAGKLRLEVKPTELIPVIKAAVDAVEHAAQAKGVRLQMILDPAASHIQGDAARLQQVVWNLLSNAVKFTPKGSLVQVKLERADAEARITVSDTGEGIAPEFLPYVFDRFRQADGSITRKNSGLGLGLSIARHLVESHGGTIQAHSAGPGAGASFIVRLPLEAARDAGPSAITRSESARPEEPAMTAEPGLLHGLRVLAVDDEPDTREMVKAVLEQYGADVITAASAREAFEALPGFRPDVMVCDIGMPEEDGYSLIGKIRTLKAEEGGNTLAIALTGYVRVEERMRALEAGYQMFVPKPVEADELVLTVASLVGRRDKQGPSTPAGSE